jgi:hypothetical protein
MPGSHLSTLVQSRTNQNQFHVSLHWRVRSVDESTYNSWSYRQVNQQGSNHSVPTTFILPRRNNSTLREIPNPYTAGVVFLHTRI